MPKKPVLMQFETPRPLYGQFGVQKGPILACFQDDQDRRLARLPVCPFPVFNEGPRSVIAVWLSNDGKTVFSKACNAP